jgi:protease-4
MKKFWIVFLVIAVIVGGSLGLLWRIMRSFDTGPELEGGLLVWQVAASYEEERDDSVLGNLLRRPTPVMRDIIFSLKRAAEDNDIQGLLLHIQALPVDWAKVEELHQAVQGFATSGKPVVAYLEGAGSKEYALAMAANEVIVAPEAYLALLGISAELSFLKNTLGKLGMQADFVHVGKYKSAPEALTRDQASAASLEMVESIVEDRYRRLVDTIATGRGAAAEQVEVWINTGLYDAPAALAAGLVDSVMCLDEVIESLFDTDARTDFHDYLLTQSGGRVDTRIALVYATGTIASGESRHDRFQGKVAGSETVIEHLQLARQDDDIAAVVLRVDSPGGSALASDLIWNEMVRLRRQKPVIVSMSGYAASGGYYISCGADSIFAEPGTMTGSIGVFAGKVDMKGFFDKIGVQREYVTRGENALIFSNNAMFTAAQRARLQNLLDDFYQRFLGKVADGRNLTSAEVATLAEGRVWSGGQAVRYGLVDGLGGLMRALDAAKRMVGLDPTEKVAVVSYERRLSFLERLLLRTFHDVRLGSDPAWPVWTAAAALARDGTLASVPLLDGRPLALLPFRIHFR